MLCTPLSRRLLLIFLSGSCLLGCDTAEKMQRHEECQTNLAEAEAAQARFSLAVDALVHARAKREEKVTLANRLVKLANEPGASESVRMEWARASGEVDAAEAELTEAQTRADRERGVSDRLQSTAVRMCDTAAGK
jgi:hypothetical protein